MWIIDFDYLGGVDLWTILDMSQASFWVPPSGYCLLCLLALRQFMAPANVLRSPAAMYLPRCCYSYRCCGVGRRAAAHSVLIAVVLCYHIDQGILLCRFVLYICHQKEEVVAIYHSLMERFPCNAGPLRTPCDMCNMLLEITYQCLFCSDCLYCVLCSVYSWKSWLDIGLVFVLQLDILIHLTILVKNINNNYLAQIVLCTRYCAPAWIVSC